MPGHPAMEAPPGVAPFLTVEDLARMFHMTDRGARLLCSRGELPACRLGRRWFVRAADLDAAIAEKVAARRREREAAARVLRGLSARKGSA